MIWLTIIAFMAIINNTQAKRHLTDREVLRAINHVQMEQNTLGKKTYKTCMSRYIIRHALNNQTLYTQETRLALSSITRLMQRNAEIMATIQKIKEEQAIFGNNIAGTMEDRARLKTALEYQSLYTPPVISALRALSHLL